MMSSPEFLTVPELADLLRIKERKVYDLAASGVVPCTRATGKLLFPESEIRAWISSHQSGARKARPAVFLGSHDPLLEWALRQSECGLATFFDGSSDGLARFAADEGIATGLHIPASGGWNTEAVHEACKGKNAVLLSWAVRQRGLVLRRDLGLEVRGFKDIAGLKLAARQPMSGTSALLDRLVAESGVRQIEMSTPYHSEQDAVMAVSEGHADVAFGLECISAPFGLTFVPVVEEKFDLLVDRAAYFEAPFQRFLTFCRSEPFRLRAERQPGYSVENLGDVRWNA